MIDVGALMERGAVLHIAKSAINVVTKTILVTCASPSQRVTQGGQDRPMEINVLINVEYMRLASVKMTWMT